MTDRDRHHLLGPVKSVSSQFASINPGTDNWEPLKDGGTLTFDRDGQEEGHRQDDAPTISTVDERGLRTTVGPRAPFVPRQAGMEYGISVNAAVKFDVLTHYDAQDRPVEIVYRDSHQEVQHRILLTYDESDRIVRERVLMGDVLGPAGLQWFGAAGSNTEPLTADQREELSRALSAAMPDNVSLTREYAYDAGGRVGQLLEQMGRLSESRRSFTYDSHDNIMEEHFEETHRDGDVDAEGNLITSNESSDESWARYEYRYDDRGNFVERVVLSRVAPDRDFHRSSVERRTITYFD